MPSRPGAGARFVTLFVTLLTGWAVPAAAQPSWDFAASTGGWWGHPREASTAERYDDEWFGSWLGSVSIGRYWTDHIKTEVDATVGSTGQRYVVRQIQLPGERSPRYYSFTQQYREQSLAALVTLQAGRNWWIHPFLQAGVSVDFDEVRYGDYPEFISGPAPFVLSRSGPESTTVTRGIAAGGAKFYMTEHAFFRADVRTSFGGGATHVQFRTGFGIDF